MPRKYELYLRDILQASERILSYTHELTEEQFSVNSQIIDAVLFNLFVIGEAVRNIPDEVRQTYAEVEWRQINALRNFIAHVYFGINIKTIWGIVETNVPRLKVDIERILSDLDTDPKGNSQAPA